jgi:hypothetical protein
VIRVLRLDQRCYANPTAEAGGVPIVRGVAD